MKWLSRLFNRKQREEEQEIEEEAVLYPGQQYECDLCQEGIYPNEQKKFGGKRFHKKCFKELKKEAKRVRLGQ